MTVRKCVDCGKIDPSNPWRVLCPRGYGLRSRGSVCVVYHASTLEFIESCQRLREDIRFKQESYDCWVLIGKILREYQGIVKYRIKRVRDRCRT